MWPEKKKPRINLSSGVWRSRLSPNGDGGKLFGDFIHYPGRESKLVSDTSHLQIASTPTGNWQWRKGEQPDYSENNKLSHKEIILDGKVSVCLCLCACTV